MRLLDSNFESCKEALKMALVVHNLGKKKPDGNFLFSNISFSISMDGCHLGTDTLDTADTLSSSVLLVCGPSGCGKTTLLKCLAQMTAYEEGTVTFGGETPDEMGYPTWRSKVMYVPQRPPQLAGCPVDYVETLRKFQSQTRRDRSLGLDPIDIGESWDLPEEIWEKNWSSLSGGQMQRAALAIAVSRNPEVLLLDEPTSALDIDTTLLVEKTLRERTCVWITHSPEQMTRLNAPTLYIGNEKGKRMVEAV